MNGTTKLKVANALMGLGVVPMVLWFAMLVNAVRALRVGEFELSDMMFTGVMGMGAYLCTLVIAGAGAVWASGLKSAASEGMWHLTRNLMRLTAAVLLLPWGGVLVLVVSRMIG